MSRDHFRVAKPLPGDKPPHTKSHLSRQEQSMRLTSAFSRTEVISWRPIPARWITVADRNRHPLCDGPSAADLNRLPAPTVRSVHAPLNDIATIAFCIGIIIVRIVKSVA
jgi:hypothetical protein